MSGFDTIKLLSITIAVPLFGVNPRPRIFAPPIYVFAARTNSPFGSIISAAISAKTASRVCSFRSSALYSSLRHIAPSPCISVIRLCAYILSKPRSVITASASERLSRKREMFSGFAESVRTRPYLLLPRSAINAVSVFSTEYFMPIFSILRFIVRTSSGRQMSSV